MAKISWNPKVAVKGKKPSQIVWGCFVYMREDGSFETEFKGETGHMMMSAAIDVLHKIRRLREEPACTFGLSPDEFDPPERI